MGFIEEREIKSLKSEMEASFNANKTGQIMMAKMLNEGLGESIKEALKNPENVPNKVPLRYRMRRALKSFKDKLKKILIYGK